MSFRNGEVELLRWGRGNSSMNSTLDVESAGDEGLTGSGEEIGEYEG